MGGFMISSAVIAAATVLFQWIMKDEFDVTHLFHPFKFVYDEFFWCLLTRIQHEIGFLFSFSLPWDQRTPFGFFIEICFCICAGGAFYFANGVLLLWFISMCFHHQAFYEMFSHCVRQLERVDERRNQKQRLCELINFHNTAKEWVKNSNQNKCFDFGFSTIVNHFSGGFSRHPMYIAK